MEVDRKPQPKRWFLWSLLVDEDIWRLCPRYIYSIFASFGPKISVNILSVNILDPAQPENQWTRKRNEQWIRRRPCAPPKWPLGRGIATFSCQRPSTVNRLTNQLGWHSMRFGESHGAENARCISFAVAPWSQTMSVLILQCFNGNEIPMGLHDKVTWHRKKHTLW